MPLLLAFLSNLEHFIEEERKIAESIFLNEHGLQVKAFWKKRTFSSEWLPTPGASQLKCCLVLTGSAPDPWAAHPAFGSFLCTVLTTSGHEMKKLVTKPCS